MQLRSIAHVRAMASPGQIQGSRGPRAPGIMEMLGQIRETIPLVRLCDSASRIVDRLDARVQSPSKDMLSLRTPTGIPQDSVYLVANPPVAQSRMPSKSSADRPPRLILAVPL